MSGEVLALIVCIFSVVITLCFGFCMINGVEPTHMMFLELLEIDIRFEPRCMPFFVSAIYFTALGSHTVSLPLLCGLCYMLVAVACIAAVCPIKITKNYVKTTGFGNLEQDQLIHIFRTQQIFNRLLAEIFATIVVSIHFVQCMIIFLVVAYASIAYKDFLLGQGFIFTLMCIICTFLPLILIYC